MAQIAAASNTQQTVVSDPLASSPLPSDSLILCPNSSTMSSTFIIKKQNKQNRHANTTDVNLPLPTTNNAVPSPTSSPFFFFIQPSREVINQLRKMTQQSIGWRWRQHEQTTM